MKTLQINTTQNVPITFNVADVGHRILAFIIDNILKIGYLYSVFYLLLTDFNFGWDTWSQQAFFVIIWLPVTFYTLFSEMLMNGQTIGKKILKIKVVNIDGFKPSKADYIIRWFLRIVDFNFWLLIFVYAYSLGILKKSDYAFIIWIIFVFGKLVGFLSILITKNNQRLGDLAGNTVVISLKDDVRFSQTILVNLSETYTPTYPNVILLSDNDLRIIKENFLIAKKEKDLGTLIKLRDKIVEVTKIEVKHDNNEEFIATILKDYNYYTQDM